MSPPTITSGYHRRANKLMVLVVAAMLALGVWLLAEGVKRSADVLGCTWERANQQSTATTNEECKP